MRVSVKVKVRVNLWIRVESGFMDAVGKIRVSASLRIMLMFMVIG